jgi:hypothetical protein
MKFKITPHAGFAPPEDAVEQLWQRLGAKREEVSFALVGAEIRATLSEDAPVSMTQDERVGIGRRTVLDIVREVCERPPALKSDWFAVGPVR